MAGHEECGNYTVPHIACHYKGAYDAHLGGRIRGLRRHTELCEIRDNFGDLYLTHRGSKIMEILVPGSGVARGGK